MLQEVKKWILAGTGFFLAVAGLTGVYAAAVWGALPSANTGAPLTSTAWNDLVGHVNDIAGAIRISSGNVGMGTAPTKKLDVAGDVRFSGNLYPTAPIHYQAMLSPGTGTIKPAAGSALPFSRVAFNYGGAYDASTSTFTAPVKGMYEFCISLYSWNDTGTSGSVILSPPDSPGAWVLSVMNYHANSSWEDNHKCRQKALSAGQQMKYYVINSSGLNIATNDYTYVNGRLLYAQD